MALKSPASRRYAQALVDFVEGSKGKSSLETVQQELDRFVEAMSTSFDLKNSLLNPSFSASERENAVRGVMKALNLSDVVQRFILLVAGAKRIREIGDITDAFRNMADERRGRMRAVVEAAAPL